MVKNNGKLDLYLLLLYLVMCLSCLSIIFVNNTILRMFCIYVILMCGICLQRHLGSRQINTKINANLSMLIYEILDILDGGYYSGSEKWRIKELLSSWIKANDLHPERVVIISNTNSSGE